MKKMNCCDPMENRTPVTGMRTRCPNRWTMGPVKRVDYTKIYRFFLYNRIAPRSAASFHVGNVKNTEITCAPGFSS
jgi:hypothetical protein